MSWRFIKKIAKERVFQKKIQVRCYIYFKEMDFIENVGNLTMSTASLLTDKSFRVSGKEGVYHRKKISLCLWQIFFSSQEKSPKIPKNSVFIQRARPICRNAMHPPFQRNKADLSCISLSTVPKLQIHPISSVM